METGRGGVPALSEAGAKGCSRSQRAGGTGRGWTLGPAVPGRRLLGCGAALGSSLGAQGGERSSTGAQLWPGDKVLPLRARLVQSSQRCRERATLSRLHFEWKLKSAVKQVQKSL